MELLPAERNIHVEQRDIALTERLLQSQDAAVILCERDATLDRLPFGALLASLHRKASQRGSVGLLSTRVGSAATVLVVAFIKSSASAFDRLSAAAKAWKELAPHAPSRVVFATHDLDASVARDALEAMTAAALAGTAPLPVMKSKPPRHTVLERITLIGRDATIDADRTLAMDRGNHLARWLTTLPPNVLSSGSYRRALMTLARRHGWGFQFFDEGALKRLGAGAFLAVARANGHRDAGIVRLRYRAPKAGVNAPRLALVGKGICFDTGGINLKPHRSMVQMHEDMQGSAVAVGTLLALSEMQAPCHIDCWLAITENEIGARAYRPQEVIKAINGVTIQVVHSDAEGRMALADTLALAAREQPGLVIDYATLTGACVTALTERYSGAFTNRPEWHTAIELAGRHSGERVWPFPMEEDYDADLDSPIADILQCTIEGKGDHILAARFLNRFVPAEIPWIHIDLSASNRSGGLAHIPTDFTGFGVRFTTSLLLDHDLLRARKRAKKATEKRPTGKLRRARK
ncbi:MAG TPA: M17 family metallopeptidase [Povalibacter sp.]|uniref:M17 family metallopeptidase n=1 Tax=Povalibacter sp. TaxID=1962978 RepID=UPI002CF9680F|nr:M17 family metallopeptidase [Povalibacter sp.]HMN44069.1 M17 family metallopeptidase [Povalibacter sp.]